jgi:glycine oxidase
VNITVVGAGIVGCAIAHELASRGARVQLLDSRGVGRGATHASAGILAPHIEGHTPELHELASRSLAMYDDFVGRVQRDSGRSVEYARNGTLQVALDERDAAALANDARTLATNGVEHLLTDRDGARRMVPVLSDRVTSGLLVPSQGYVAAATLTDAVAAAACARGARLTTTMVVGVEGASKSARVITSDETIESDAVVVASGSWAVSSKPESGPVVTPIRGQLLRLRCDEVLAPHVLWGPACYVVPWSNGTVLVGATVEDVGFDERATAGGVKALLDAAIELVPALERAEFDEVRVGFRPKSVDELPIIGRSDTMPRVFYAVGHYRNGVLLSPLTAALMADLILENRERAELALVRPGRLANV